MINRRNFLKQSATGAAVVTMTGVLAKAQAVSKRTKETGVAKAATLPRTPEEFFSIMEARFNSLDVRQAIELFHPDAIFVDASGRVHKGIAAIKTELTKYFATGLQMEMTHRHVFASDDTALSINDWSYNGVANGVAKGGGTTKMSGTTSDVLIRCGDGVWRYIIDNPYGTQVRG